MNERTKELMEQCGWINLDTSDFRIGYFSGIGIEKFAKLMVKEFQNILRDNRGEATGTLSYRVEEHFGVEV